MQKTATPTYYCVAFAQNCVANCTATPDKLFPVLRLDFLPSLDYINNPTQNCLNQILIRSGCSWTYVVLFYMTLRHLLFK